MIIILIIIITMIIITFNDHYMLYIKALQPVEWNW